LGEHRSLREVYNNACDDVPEPDSWHVRLLFGDNPFPIGADRTQAYVSFQRRFRLACTLVDSRRADTRIDIWREQQDPHPYPLDPIGHGMGAHMVALSRGAGARMSFPSGPCVPATIPWASRSARDLMHAPVYDHHRSFANAYAPADQRHSAANTGVVLSFDPHCEQRSPRQQHGDSPMAHSAVGSARHNVDTFGSPAAQRQRRHSPEAPSYSRQHDGREGSENLVVFVTEDGQHMAVRLCCGRLVRLSKSGRFPDPISPKECPSELSGNVWDRETAVRLACLGSVDSRYVWTGSFISEFLHDGATVLAPNNPAAGRLLALGFLVGLPNVWACQLAPIPGVTLSVEQASLGIAANIIRTVDKIWPSLHTFDPEGHSYPSQLKQCTEVLLSYTRGVDDGQKVTEYWTALSTAIFDATAAQIRLTRRHTSFAGAYGSSEFECSYVEQAKRLMKNVMAPHVFKQPTQASLLLGPARQVQPVLQPKQEPSSDHKPDRDPVAPKTFDMKAMAEARYNGITSKVGSMSDGTSKAFCLRHLLNKQCSDAVCKYSHADPKSASAPPSAVPPSAANRGGGAGRGGPLAH
jgi:hypothetical protein